MFYPHPPSIFEKHLWYLGYTNIIVSFDGWVYDTALEDYLPIGIHPTGYRYVDIWQDGKRYRNYIHRLVAFAFLLNDDPENKTQVNHKNGNKANNCAANLEWCTRLENIHHARKHGLYPQMYLTDETVRLICSAICAGMKNADIARAYRITPSAVGCIKTGKTWKHISSLYPGLPTAPDHRYARK